MTSPRAVDEAAPGLHPFLAPLPFLGVSATKKAGGWDLPPPGPADDHVDIASATPGANEPRLPVKHGRLRTIAGGVLSGIGLDLVAAIPAPYDRADAGRGSTAERHRRARAPISSIPRSPKASHRRGCCVWTLFDETGINAEPRGKRSIIGLPFTTLVRSEE